LERLYSRYVREYSLWLGTLHFGYGKAERQTMPWSAHLEALGLSEESSRFLSRRPLVAGESPWIRKNDEGTEGTALVDDASWGKIRNGMSEAEVFRLLGPPKQKDLRRMSHRYVWRYTAPTPTSPAERHSSEELSVSFILGRVSGKERKKTIST